jgi:hypothetical protein
VEKSTTDSGGGTRYGDYIKTQEAWDKAEEGRSKWIEDNKASRLTLITVKKGERGTLDYGKTFFIFREEPSERIKELNERLGKKPPKPTYWVHKVDFGLLGSHETSEFHGYKHEKAARKKLDELASMYLPKSSLQHGGPGSGWTAEDGHVPGSQGGSGEDEAHAAKVAKAKASYNPMNKEKKRIATENEVKVADITGGRHTLDSDAFDVILPKSVVEVKTIVAGKNDKITMHPESIRRKQTLAKQMKMKGHTVVFDNRNGKIYYKKGFGSFRLGNMQEVSSLNELGRLLA